MSLNSGTSQHRVLMMAYSYYESDPRVIREAEAAVEGGFDVDFLTLRRPGAMPSEMIRGVRVFRLNQEKYRGGRHVSYLVAYLLFFLRCFAKTTMLFFSRRYRVIHVNNMPDFLVFTTIIPRVFGTKVILDIHDPMPNTFASKFRGGEQGFFYRLLLWQERISAAYSSQVITVHEPVRDGILVKHSLPRDSVEVIANFADERMFPLRKSFSVDGRIKCAFHGTIVQRSGLRLLMEALEKVRNKDRIAVKLIGEGDFSQPLREMIASMRLENVVEFDNRSYPVHAIVDRIADCNVGLVPLEISSVTNYALPLKLIEYISLGLPVVTVRNAAITHYLSEDDCMFFEPNSPDSLASVLDRIAENPQILHRYRQRSIALRPRFSWTGEKRKYVALLTKLTQAF
ncbi:MAG TPA: glycosyltransferase family 4 protein [Bryobacteraceae bacterium]|nr:glycosyltransferase family 4 protein [Bryobacteraceae bacterium]